MPGRRVRSGILGRPQPNYQSRPTGLGQNQLTALTVAARFPDVTISKLATPVSRLKPTPFARHAACRPKPMAGISGTAVTGRLVEVSSNSQLGRDVLGARRARYPRYGRGQQQAEAASGDLRYMTGGHCVRRGGGSGEGFLRVGGIQPRWQGPDGALAILRSMLLNELKKQTTQAHLSHRGRGEDRARPGTEPRAPRRDFGVGR
jgi:hypothetical protein